METTDRYFRCAIVKCKTEGCETGLVLQVIEEVEPKPNPIAFTISILRECREFQETCPNCGREHTYSRLDIEQVTLVNQPLGFLARSFAQATAPLPEGKQGESGGKN